MSKTDDKLRSIYYDPITGFGGVDKLYRAAKKVIPTITKSTVRNWLKKQEVNQLTQKVNTRKFNSFIADHPLQQIQIDLIYMKDTFLNKNSYVLMAVDVFSKKGAAIPLKTKNARDVANGMSQVFKRIGVPESTFSDYGSEFKNQYFDALTKKKDVEVLFSTNHAPFVERFNRTIKEILYKFLRVAKSKSWVKALPLVIKNYNNSFHSAIGMTPNEATDKKNRAKVRENLLNRSKRVSRPTLKKGDRVRVKHVKGVFTKGFEDKWTEKIHTISNIDETKFGKMYNIQGSDRDYLRPELKKVAGEVETFTPAFDLSGTREGKLREIAKRPVTEESKQRAKELKEANENQYKDKPRRGGRKKKQKKMIDL